MPPPSPSPISLLLRALRLAGFCLLAALALSQDAHTQTTYTLDANPDELTEDGGSQSVTITVTAHLGDKPQTTISITTGGCAGTDSIALSSGASSGSTTFTFTPTNDSIYTGTQVCPIGGTSSAGGSVSGTYVYIRDDESPRQATPCLSQTPPSRSTRATLLTTP